MLYDLTLARAMQIAHAIGERLVHEEKQRLKALEWQTQVLAQFIACTAPEAKQQKALLEQARNLVLLREDKEEIERKPGENMPGSFEALMGGFAG